MSNAIQKTLCPICAKPFVKENLNLGVEVYQCTNEHSWPKYATKNRKDERRYQTVDYH